MRAATGRALLRPSRPAPAGLSRIAHARDCHRLRRARGHRLRPFQEHPAPLIATIPRERQGRGLEPRRPLRIIPGLQPPHIVPVNQISSFNLSVGLHTRHPRCRGCPGKQTPPRRRRYPATARAPRPERITSTVLTIIDTAKNLIAPAMVIGAALAHGASNALVSIAVNEGLAAADNAMRDPAPHLPLGRLPRRRQVLPRQRHRHGRVRGPVNRMPLLHGTPWSTSPGSSPARTAPRRCSTWAPRSSRSSRRPAIFPGGLSQRRRDLGYYTQQNAGKRNVSIDLNVPGARDAIARLCESRT